jgi:hypothetical protein
MGDTESDRDKVTKVSMLIRRDIANDLRTLSATGDLEGVLREFLARAMDGIRRSGSWEREWLEQGFSSAFQERLKPNGLYHQQALQIVWGCPHRGNDPGGAREDGSNSEHPITIDRDGVPSCKSCGIFAEFVAWEGDEVPR